MVRMITVLSLSLLQLLSQPLSLFQLLLQSLPLSFLHLHLILQSKSIKLLLSSFFSSFSFFFNFVSKLDRRSRTASTGSYPQSNSQSQPLSLTGPLVKMRVQSNDMGTGKIDLLGGSGHGKDGDRVRKNRNDSGVSGEVERRRGGNSSSGGGVSGASASGSGGYRLMVSEVSSVITGSSSVSVENKERERERRIDRGRYRAVSSDESDMRQVRNIYHSNLNNLERTWSVDDEIYDTIGTTAQRKEVAQKASFREDKALVSRTYAEESSGCSPQQNDLPSEKNINYSTNYDTNSDKNYDVNVNNVKYDSSSRSSSGSRRVEGESENSRESRGESRGGRRGEGRAEISRERVGRRGEDVSVSGYNAMDSSHTITTTSTEYNNTRSRSDNSSSSGATGNTNTSASGIERDQKVSNFLVVVILCYVYLLILS